MLQVNNTSIGLPESVRTRAITLLNTHVGIFTDLYVQVKLAHWNVRGSHFIAYHELFDAIAGRLLEAQDMMAERAATLGGTAGVTVQAVADSTSLPAWPLAVRQDREVIHLVAERLGQAANAIRTDIDTAATLGDADTADLFTEVSRQLDKDLWFVEAHFSS